MINVKSQVSTFRDILVNILQTQFIVTSVTYHFKQSALYLDSHTDTCVLGANNLVIQYHGGPFNALSYNLDLGDRTYQTVSGVIG